MKSNVIDVSKLNEVRKSHGSNLVFRHFKLNALVEKDGNPNSVGVGNVTVALLRPEKNSNTGEYTAAVAFGSPSDMENRKLARDIATGRLLSNRPGRNFTFKVTVGPTVDLTHVFDVALDMASDKNFLIKKKNQTVTYAPTWVQNSLDTGYDFH